MSEDQDEHLGASNFGTLDLLSVMALAPGGYDNGVVDSIVTIAGNSFDRIAGVIAGTGQNEVASERTLVGDFILGSEDNVVNTINLVETLVFDESIRGTDPKFGIGKGENAKEKDE